MDQRQPAPSSLDRALQAARAAMLSPPLPYSLEEAWARVEEALRDHLGPRFEPPPEGEDWPPVRGAGPVKHPAGEKPQETPQETLVPDQRRGAQK